MSAPPSHRFLFSLFLADGCTLTADSFLMLSQYLRQMDFMLCPAEDSNWIERCDDAYAPA